MGFAQNMRSYGHVARRGSSFIALSVLALTAAFGQDDEALRGGNLEAAAGAFTRCTQLQPAFAEAWFNLGLARFQQNDIDAAIPALTRSLQLKPKMHGANLFVGIAEYRKNDYKAAASALEREVQGDPASADALMWLGIVELATGSTVDAVVNLEKAARLRPTDVDVLYHLGRAYMTRSKETYERMYVAGPKSWRVHQVLAQSFLDADRFDDAVKECEEAIRLKPNEPGLHQQLGDIYDRQNNLEMADAEYRNELKIDPHNAAVMYSLAVVSIERSKPADAVDLLSEALRRAPGSVEAHYQLGRAEAQLGQNDSAAVNFAAVVANPKSVDSEMLRQSYYQLAQLYRRLHRPEESRAALDSFARLKQQADTEQSHKLEDKLRKSVQAQQQ
jgi:tetratricopeptide (TPR) repeat protein